MLGLIKKDLMILAMQSRVFALFFLGYAAMGFFMKDASMLAVLVLMVVATMPLTSTAYDEQAKWERYALTMPLRRSQLVASKYLLVLLLAAATTLLAGALAAGTAVVKGRNPLESLLTVVVSAPLSLLFVSILLPVVVKLGVEKARIAIMAVFMIPALLVMLFFGFVQKPTEAFLASLVPLLPFIAAGFGIFMLALFAGSYLLSVRFAKQKEY